MRNNKSITNPKLGMRIKIALPTSWCQVHNDSPYCWLKGKIIEIPNDKTIVISIWSKKVGKIERMMCFKRDGIFQKIIKQL
jgi:hypothetical protein